MLAFLLNIDWFQPFKHISYSVGVIYAVILNLPHNLIYKDNNVVIVGVIPGPKEPKHDVNSYLGPLVTELLELYSGVWFDTSYSKQFIRGVLLVFHPICLPQGRQLVLLNIEINGCSRCLKSFITNSENKTDYSGYNRDSWVGRTNDLHRTMWQNKGRKKVIEQRYGARYCTIIAFGL